MCCSVNDCRLSTATMAGSLSRKCRSSPTRSHVSFQANWKVAHHRTFLATATGGLQVWSDVRICQRRGVGLQQALVRKGIVVGLEHPNGTDPEKSE